MSRSVLLAEARIPDTAKSLLLYQHKDKFSIVIPGRGELMNSRVHGSERALAELACERMGQPAKPRLLVGGLGMGFTQAAALAATGPDAEIVAAELVPEVVDWHREWIGEPANWVQLALQPSAVRRRSCRNRPITGSLACFVVRLATTGENRAKF